MKRARNKMENFYSMNCCEQSELCKLLQLKASHSKVHTFITTHENTNSHPVPQNSGRVMNNYGRKFMQETVLRTRKTVYILFLYLKKSMMPKMN